MVKYRCYGCARETIKKRCAMEIATGSVLFFFFKGESSLKLSDGCDVVPGVEQFVDDELSDSKNSPLISLLLSLQHGFKYISIERCRERRENLPRFSRNPADIILKVQHPGFPAGGRQVNFLSSTPERCCCRHVQTAKCLFFTQD